jgi:hypothetical protein
VYGAMLTVPSISTNDDSPFEAACAGKHHERWQLRHMDVKEVASNQHLFRIIDMMLCSEKQFPMHGSLGPMQTRQLVPVFFGPTPTIK